MLGPPRLRCCLARNAGVETSVLQEIIMATLRVKPRTRPADGKVDRNPATSTRDNPVQGKAPEQKAAGETPARCRSLREYLKVNH
jgi:hypothetical protein